jgi:hypothetical protein
MEYHHADSSTRLVFDDVKTALGLPFLNTDYRALARWPSYFALAWADLRPRLRRGEYETIVAQIHEAAVSNVRSLPNYGNLRGVAHGGSRERAGRRSFIGRAPLPVVAARPRGKRRFLSCSIAIADFCVVRGVRNGLGIPDQR